MNLVIIDENARRVNNGQLNFRERLALRLLRDQFAIPKKLYKKHANLVRVLEKITTHLHKIYIDPPEHYGPTLDKLYNEARKLQGRKELVE